MDSIIPGAHVREIEIDGTLRTVHIVGTGQPVLCLHGFPDTIATWIGIAEGLVSEGYQVIMPVMRGYEASSADPNGDFSMAALAGDVVGLIDALELGQVHLVGHDWGASIGFAACAKAPAAIASFTAMAVPHPGAFGTAIMGNYDQQKLSWYIFLFQLRGVAELVISANDGEYLKRLWADWSPSLPENSLALKEMAAAFSDQNILASALSYYRTSFDPAHPRAAEGAALLSKPIEVPVLGLHGELDGCISTQAFEASMPEALFSKGLTVLCLNGLGHFAHLEDPSAVISNILPFLKSNSGVSKDLTAQTW
jgi:pimeloyl-ACP methyl ester carboxylesterase